EMLFPGSVCVKTQPIYALNRVLAQMHTHLSTSARYVGAACGGRIGCHESGGSDEDERNLGQVRPDRSDRSFLQASSGLHPAGLLEPTTGRQIGHHSTP